MPVSYFDTNKIISSINLSNRLKLSFLQAEKAAISKVDNLDNYTKVLYLASLTNSIKHIKKRLKDDFPDFEYIPNFYDLRHKYLELLSRSGVPVGVFKSAENYTTIKKMIDTINDLDKTKRFVYGNKPIV